MYSKDMKEERLDELERLNQDLKAVKMMLLTFASSVVIWAATIMVIISLLK